MNSTTATAVNALTALGCGLMAGVFFTFSSFVMTALTRLAPEEGIRAMQSINVGAVRSGFLAAFFATAALSVAVGIFAVGNWSQPGSCFAISGAITYLVGGILVTIVFNVPMNDSLAAVSANSPDAPVIWAGYLARWTAWNHVRTFACLSASALLTISLLVRE